jgi:cytochrome c553
MDRLVRTATILLACEVFFSCAESGRSHFTDLRQITPIVGDAQVGARKATVCASCHGADGVPVAPTFPRLAGQRINYLYTRLASFRQADTQDPYYASSPMTAMAANLSETDMRDLAAHFASQKPRPTTATVPAVSPQKGEALFLHGDPSHGLPPCQGCHGSDANGPPSWTGPYAAYPSLRGQNSQYLVDRLSNYREGKPADTSNSLIMHGVASALDDQSIQALSEWLGSLPSN